MSLVLWASGMTLCCTGGSQSGQPAALLHSAYSYHLYIPPVSSGLLGTGSNWGFAMVLISSFQRGTTECIDNSRLCQTFLRGKSYRIHTLRGSQYGRCGFKVVKRLVCINTLLGQGYGVCMGHTLDCLLVRAGVSASVWCFLEQRLSVFNRSMNV